MKYIVVLGDGMADRPLAELGNKTPLQVAATPCLDRLAATSEIGLAATIPEGMKPGSDTANLAVLGYDPKVYYSGRSPLEALSIGVPMKDTDIALRVNLVTITDDDMNEDGTGIPFGQRVIIDHSSGEIATQDAAALLEACREVMENDEFKFYVGTSYRHCCIWDKGEVFELAQPHDHLTEKIGQYLPANEKFLEMMEKSFEILNHHPINERRRKLGKNVANCMWFWGAGTKPQLSPFIQRTGKKGAMISAVDLLKGIAVGADMKVIEVEGANGQLETNYEGKADAALHTLLREGNDFVYVHVEAPDEMGHQGSVERKIKSIEYLDSRLISRLVDGLNAEEVPFRMLVMPDHPTPISIRTHSSEPVPYLLYDSTKPVESTVKYDEEEAGKTGILVKPGSRMIDKLLEMD